MKIKLALFLVLILFFLGFSFYPTVFELRLADKLSDPSREFILEHNFYWPDYNLYLSKIRQGFEGKWTAMEKYTSENHKGSLIQGFYLYLGKLGSLLDLNPNYSYLLGRLILSPLLLTVIALLCIHFFKNPLWQLTSFVVVMVSGSFPRFFTNDGKLAVGRYMEWWSNIDAVQRITFIPHILFGQIVSFFLLYNLTIKQSGNTSKKKLFLYIILGNLTGLVFPPSLITLNSVLGIMLIFEILSKRNFRLITGNRQLTAIFFIVLSLPSLLYILILTRQMPWSSLVEYHRTHPMMIPFWDYIRGTGPVFFLAIAGAVFSILRKDTKFIPLILWFFLTFVYAVLFTFIKEQSPLRFTQTGLFIPLGILSAYLFLNLWNLAKKISPTAFASEQKTGNDGENIQVEVHHIAKTSVIVLIFSYIVLSLYMMTVSLKWQTTFITQRVRAFVPAVPFPPQTMYPLKEWMQGIRWLRDNTRHDEVVVAEITAGNHIPAYSGNTVYFGQSNTVNYEMKQVQVTKFFKGEMKVSEASEFLKTGGIRYVFFGVQEKERAGKEKLEEYYPFLKELYSNSTITIYSPEWLIPR